MIKEAPKGWKSVKFDSFFTVLPSKKYQVQKQDYLERGLIPVVDQGQKLIIGYTDDQSKKFNKNKVIVFGDHTRIVKYIDFEFAVGADGTQILETKDGIDLKFGYYQLLNTKIPDTGYNRHFKYVKAEKYVIPPTLAEQQEIVQILDTISDIIRLREECISHAQDLIPALFQEMFKNYENDKISLSNICDIKGGKRLPQGEKLIDERTNHPYIRVTNFKNQSIDMSDIKYITEEVYQKISRYVITTNDIYISIAGTIGLVGDIPAELNNANLTENAAKLVINKKEVNKKYLIYCLNSPYLQRQIKEATVGVGVPKLALARIGALKVYLPPIKLQEQFAQKAIEIEYYIKEQQEELEKAKQMFQSLLHHAFTGELTRRAYGN